jgi:hypothetical protein
MAQVEEADQDGDKGGDAAQGQAPTSLGESGKPIHGGPTDGGGGRTPSAPTKTNIFSNSTNSQSWMRHAEG